MQGIGERLREARMREEIDIDDVESATKIRAKYLRAMENEEFGLLPGPTFVKTFLRTYAQYLGLDAHLLVQEYRARHEPDTEAEAQPYTSPQRQRSGGGGRPGGSWIGPIVGLALVALLAVLFVLGRTAEQSPDERTATPAPSTTTREPARRQRRRRPVARSVSLRVAPAESTYLCVETGAGDVVYEGTLAAPRTFRGRRLRVNLGRRSATVRVNGRRVRIEPGAEPVGLDLRPRRAARRLTAAQRPNCAA